jgi:hypothetical protein
MRGFWLFLSIAGSFSSPFKCGLGESCCCFVTSIMYALSSSRTYPEKLELNETFSLVSLFRRITWAAEFSYVFSSDQLRVHLAIGLGSCSSAIASANSCGFFVGPNLFVDCHRHVLAGIRLRIWECGGERKRTDACMVCYMGESERKAKKIRVYACFEVPRAKDVCEFDFFHNNTHTHFCFNPFRSVPVVYGLCTDCRTPAYHCQCDNGTCSSVCVCVHVDFPVGWVLSHRTQVLHVDTL